MTAKLESSIKLNPSKSTEEVLKHLRLEIDEIHETIKLNSYLNIKEKFQSEEAIGNTEIPSSEDTLRPLSERYFLQLPSGNNLKITSPSWGLNLKSLTLVALFCIGSFSHQLEVGALGGGIHKIEPINNVVLTASVEKVVEVATNLWKSGENDQMNELAQDFIVEEPTSFCLASSPYLTPTSNLFSMIETSTALNPSTLLADLKLDPADVTKWKGIIKKNVVKFNVKKFEDFLKLIIEMVKHEPGYAALLQLEDYQGLGPISWAAMAGKKDLIQELIGLGLDVDALSVKKGKTPFQLSIDTLEKTDSNIAFATFLETKTNLNALDQTGNTALHIGVRCFSKKTVDKLISAGVDVNAVDNQGNTPLHLACTFNQKKIVEMLLKAGAKINLPNELGINPMHIVRLKKDNTILSIFEEVGIKIVDLEIPKESSVLTFRGHVDEWLARYNPLNLFPIGIPSVWHVKYLSHSWELGGKSIANGMLVEHGGFDFRLTSNYIINSLQEFAQNYPEIAGNHLTAITDALLDTSSLFFSNRIHIENFKKGKPVIINFGVRTKGLFSGHAISVVIQGSTIMICNKGFGTKRPIEAYDIDPNEFTLEVLAEIQMLSSFSHIDQFYAAFGKGIDRSKEPGYLLTRLKSKGITPACQWLEGLLHSTTHQSMGNCAWESVETAVYASVALSFVDQGKEGRKKAYELFDSWQQFTKLKTLEEYVQQSELIPHITSESEMRSISNNLINIFKKAADIPWRLDFQKRIEDLRALAIDLQSQGFKGKSYIGEFATKIYNKIFGITP